MHQSSSASTARVSSTVDSVFLTATKCVSMWIRDHLVYTENIAYASAGFLGGPIILKLVWFFESQKVTSHCDY